MTDVETDGKIVEYTYNGSNTALSKITHNGFDYAFTYDGFGNVLTTKAAGKTLMTNTYQANNGSLLKSTYGNGAYNEYTYDSVGRVTHIKNNGNGTFFWRYNADGNVDAHTDYVTDRVYYYTYDSLGRVVEELETTRGTTDYRFESDYVYDVSNNLTKVSNRADGRTVSTAYTYDKINRPTKTTINSSVNYTYTYDSLGRHNFKYLNGTEQIVTIDYDFANSKNRTATDTVTYKTTQISKEKIADRTYAYTYGKRGNITKITEKVGSGAAKEKATYTYDALGQLKTENNVDLGQRIVYTYDAGGNISSKKIYAYTNGTVGDLIDTINYTYDTTWKDQLKSYDGQSINYDAIGNPTSYKGATLEWNGRQLVSYSKGDLTVTYKYDADGLRTQKTVNGVVYNYGYENGKLVYERKGDEYEVIYRYDADGNLFTVNRCIFSSGYTSLLYAVNNTRGDVVALYKGGGGRYSTYTYDSWGKPVVEATGMSAENSVRYRGYVYDQETGLYYLQSRYYDPETGRFLNADDVDYIGYSGEDISYNAFAYCENEPVGRLDVLGYTYIQLFDAAYKNVILNILIEYIKDKEDFKEGKRLIKRIENATKIYFDSQKTNHEGIIRYSITIRSGEYVEYWDDYIFYLGDWFAWDTLISSYENNFLYKIATSDSISLISSIASFILGIKYELFGIVSSVIDIAADIPMSKFTLVVKGSRSALNTSEALKSTDVMFMLLTKIQVYSYVVGLENTSYFYVAYSGDDSIGVVIK